MNRQFLDSVDTLTVHILQQTVLTWNITLKMTKKSQFFQHFPVHTYRLERKSLLWKSRVQHKCAGAETSFYSERYAYFWQGKIRLKGVRAHSSTETQDKYQCCLAGLRCNPLHGGRAAYFTPLALRPDSASSQRNGVTWEMKVENVCKRFADPFPLISPFEIACLQISYVTVHCTFDNEIRSCPLLNRFVHIGIKTFHSFIYASTVFTSWTHGESDFVASTKRFVNIATANQNCWGDNFTCYGDDCNCCGNNSYCCC